MEFRRVLFRSLFYWLARLVERRPALRRLKPVAVVRTFEETVRVEMDLRLEASADPELAGNFAGDPAFRLPAIDWRRTATSAERRDGNAWGAPCSSRGSPSDSNTTNQYSA